MRGASASTIARHLGCDVQTARTAFHAFNALGQGGLTPGAPRHRIICPAFEPAAERLVALLHRRPRDFGRPTSLWTLEPATAVT